MMIGSHRNLHRLEQRHDWTMSEFAVDTVPSLLLLPLLFLLCVGVEADLWGCALAMFFKQPDLYVLYGYPQQTGIN